MYEEIYNEIFDLFDETMEINHQITEHLIKIAQADMAGVKIEVKRSGRGRKKHKSIEMSDVEENSTIRILFERLQEKYRLMQEKIEEFSNLQDINLDKDFVSAMLKDENKESTEKEYGIYSDLEEYLKDSYESMKYMPNGYEKSIYDGKPFYLMHYAEYNLQIMNLEKMRARASFNEKRDRLNFEEKSYILDDLAKKIFYKSFAMRQIDSYISQWENSKSTTDDEKYKYILSQLYSEKYILIDEYLQNKYNGIMQENDIGKIARVKQLIDDGAINIALGLSDYDIRGNIERKMKEYKNRLKENVYEILGIEEKCETNEKEKNDKKQEKTSSENDKDNKKEDKITTGTEEQEKN